MCMEKTKDIRYVMIFPRYPFPYLTLFSSSLHIHLYTLLRATSYVGCSIRYVGRHLPMFQRQRLLGLRVFLHRHDT